MWLKKSIKLFEKTHRDTILFLFPIDFASFFLDMYISKGTYIYRLNLRE